MSLTKFAILALATWRLASLIVRENGPFDVFTRVRAFVGAEDEGELRGFAELFSCVWCMSVWTAMVLYLTLRVPILAIGLAASAAAVIIDERVVRR